MTREEAIKILNKYDLNFCDIDGNPIPPQDLAEAFDMAIEALEQEPKCGKWIPLNAIGGEPEDNGEYLLQLSDGFITSTYYDGKDWELWADAGEPVAWMPLPEPYKESDDWEVNYCPKCGARMESDE